jgi:glycosyltransferase involved in cell wall biosynthesis
VIRVLHVLSHLEPGGAQDNTLLTVAGLDRSRYVVDVAAGPGPLAGRAAEVADHLYVLDTLHRSLADPGIGPAFARLWRLCQSYDVVHTHGSKAGVLGRVAARGRHVPAIVHTMHGLPVTVGTGRAERVPLLAAERLATRCSDRVVFVCRTNAVEAERLGLGVNGKARVIVSGVLPGYVASTGGPAVRAALGIPLTAPVVGTITRFMPQKAPLDFVAAAARVLATLPAAHVVVVGDGPDREQVRAAAAGFPRLHLLGYRSDVGDVIDACDVMAFSSLWEGLGRALTESVLAGKPVVSTAVDGVPELVVPGETGELVPPRRPDLLAARILDVLALPDRGASLGAAGAQRIAGEFDVERMVSDIDALYQEVLAERAAAR